MRRKIYQYYVEGECEKRLIEVLKGWNGCNNGLIKQGKISVFNPVQELFSPMRLMQLEEGTTVILVYDTDVADASILLKNKSILSKYKTIKEVWFIPQVGNLEEELIRCTDIRGITELLPSRSKTEFKHDFCCEKKLKEKLEKHKFDYALLWARNPKGDYAGMGNDKSKL